MLMSSGTRTTSAAIPRTRRCAAAGGRISLSALLVLLVSVAGFASPGAEPGGIIGTITDAETGEPLPSVNVVLKGTHKGATTDLDGNYFIPLVNPGGYDLRASFVGYKVALKTNVRVGSGERTRVDLQLEPTVLALGEEVVVIGKKPLLDVEETATTRRISSEDISDLAVENVTDVLEQQVGIVRDNNQIHIRGGRADENLYIIDDISVKDPISGQGLGIYLSAESIKELEVITGGFNAEYGQAMSGLVNVETKEGGTEYTGSFSTKTDNISGWPPAHQNTNSIEFSFGGPDPLAETLLPRYGVDIPGNSSIFFNGYGYITDTHLPSASRELVPRVDAYDPLTLRQENNYSLLGKYTYRPLPTLKFIYSYGRSVQVNQGYFDAVVEDRRYFPLDYKGILNRYNTITREGIQQSFHVKHTLNNTTFYELTLGNFYNRVHSAAQGKHWSEYEEPVDFEPVFYEVGEDGEVNVKYGDGLWDGGNSDTWHDHYNDTWQLRGNITSRLNDRHEMKAGLEYEQTKLQLVSIHDPWVASTAFGGDYDMYHALSEAGAFFVQDRIEFKGMIANVGLRLDWWRPGQYVEDAIEDPEIITLTPEARRLFEEETVDIFDRRIKMHLSPRLGVSHPVTDNDVLFFSYGHFSQRPKYAHVYAKLRSYSPSTYQLFGNPNLNPQTTVAYELGIKHRFTGDKVVELVAFNKDLFDYATSFNVRSTNPRLGNISYYQYFNIDYARVRGLEVRFRARQGRYLTGNADFAYQIATGKSSSANAEIQAAAETTVGEKTLGEEYLAWDRPFNASVTLWLRIPEKDPPRWFGFRWPSRWGGSVRWEGGSGKRYTPAKLTNNGQDLLETGDRYSEVAKWWNTVDLRLWKEFTLDDGLDLRLFAEVLNVFDFKKPTQINPLTGEPYEQGDPAPRQWENPQGFIIVDPSRYEAPRQVFFGMSLRF
ncbi:MAG: Protein oar [Calditrichaeota bacterium]|nr:Protein oar [Calditrichota bacterium]